MKKKDARPRAAFDCMLYLKATANDEGPAAVAFRLLDEGAFSLFATREILAEVRDVLSRPKIRAQNPRITDQLRKLLGIHTVAIARALKAALSALLITLVTALTFNANRFAAPQAAPMRGVELQTAAIAKRALAQLGDPNFDKIKDTRARSAAQTAYLALKAVADNTVKEREATLVATFSRAIEKLKAAAGKPTAGFAEHCQNELDSCLELCKKYGVCLSCDLKYGFCYLLAYFQTIPGVQI